MMQRRRLPKWCSEFVDRHGKARVRFRRKGFATYYFKAMAWTPDFEREYAACKAGTAAPEIQPGAARTIPGTMSALIARYYASTDFANLSKASQKIYRYTIERFRAEHGDKRVAAIERSHVKAIIGAKAAMPHAANHLLTMLKLLMAFAVDDDMRSDNPTLGLRGFKVNRDGFHTWSDEEIARFEERHPIGTKARLALALLVYTAQRRADVLRMGWQHIREGRISVRQQKTGQRVDVTLHPALRAILAETPRENLTFLRNDREKPFSGTKFSEWFRERCDEAGLPHCSAHGLRKAAARRLAEAGCSANEIAAVTGHQTLKEVERYTRAVDRQRLGEAAIGRTSREPTAGKVATLHEGLAKTDDKPLVKKGA